MAQARVVSKINILAIAGSMRGGGPDLPGLEVQASLGVLDGNPLSDLGGGGGGDWEGEGVAARDRSTHCIPTVNSIAGVEKDWGRIFTWHWFGTHMIAHGGDFHAHSTIGALDHGQ